MNPGAVTLPLGDPGAPLVPLAHVEAHRVFAFSDPDVGGARFVSNAGERIQLGRALRTTEFIPMHDREPPKIRFEAGWLDVEAWTLWLLQAERERGGVSAFGCAIGTPVGFVLDHDVKPPASLSLERVTSELYPPARLAFPTGVLHLAPREARVLRAAFRLWTELNDGYPPDGGLK